jgi:hypothetical protein
LRREGNNVKVGHVREEGRKGMQKKDYNSNVLNVFIWILRVTRTQEIEQ